MGKTTKPLDAPPGGAVQGKPEGGRFTEYAFLPGDTDGIVRGTIDTYQALHTLARLMPDYVRPVAQQWKDTRFRHKVGAKTYVFTGPCGREYVVSQANVLQPDCDACEAAMLYRVSKNPSWEQIDAPPSDADKAAAKKKQEWLKKQAARDDVKPKKKGGAAQGA